MAAAIARERRQVGLVDGRCSRRRARRKVAVEPRRAELGEREVGRRRSSRNGEAHAASRQCARRARSVAARCRASRVCGERAVGAARDAAASAAEGLEPRPTGLERLACGVGDRRLVAGRLRRRELVLELLDRLRAAGRACPRRGPSSRGCSRFQSVSSQRAHVRLDLAQVVLERPHLVARDDRPISSQLRWMPVSAQRALLAVASRSSELLGLVEQRELLARGSPRTPRPPAASTSALRRIQHVARGLELRPEGVVEPSCRPGRRASTRRAGAR